MTGIKTGTPGFDIDGSSYTYDVVNEGEEGVLPIQTDKGDMSVDDSQKDISKSTKKVLADYLGRLTSINKFPVDPEQHEDYAITTKSGFPQKPSESKNDSTYTDFESPAQEGWQVQENGKPSLLTPDDRNAFASTEAQVQAIPLKKGKSEAFGFDGNDLLKNEPERIERRYTSQVLQKNRFTPELRNTPDKDFEKLGEAYNPVFKHPRHGEFSLGRLRQVAPALMHRASQEIVSTNPGYNPTGPGAGIGALLPSANQLGASKIDNAVLEVSDVLENITSEQFKGTVTSINSNSWGALNNPEDVFSGANAAGMIGLSVALTSALIIAIEGLSYIISAVSGDPAPKRTESGRYVLGRSVSSIPNQGGNFPLPVGSLLGVKSTHHPLGVALRVGLENFFGLNTNNGVGAYLGSLLKSSVTSVEYRVVMARAIIRSTITIVDTFSKFADVGESGDPVAGIQSLINSITAIRDSKIISVINVFSQLGDMILTIPEEFLAKDSVEGESPKVSLVDSLSSGPGSAIRKNRINDQSLKLAWASNRTPSLYLLPREIAGFAAVNKLGAHGTGFGTLESDSLSFFRVIDSLSTKENLGRIPYSGQSTSPTFKDVTAKMIEDALEAEYMPFYFHDLRTNEIISFHAFLASLGDSYTANWESVDAYGRVEPVHIYKSTGRKIDMSFYVVSTSETDFEDMWIKINKLVTLVYPQYTEGRTLLTGDGTSKFVQPFSQLIGASPLIRLRLGDLFKTNYTRFALARLFGFGTGETKKINDQEIAFSVDPGTIVNKLNEKKQSADPTLKWVVMGTADTQSTSGPTLNVQIGSPSNSETYAKEFSVGSDAVYLTVSIEGITGNYALVKVNDVDQKHILDVVGSTSVASELVARLRQEYGNVNRPLQRVIGGKYQVPLSQLKPTLVLIKQVISEAGGETSTEDSFATLATFLDPEKNAVVKAFESTAGKGIAGKIESMSFDWFDRTTWSIEPGSKAPRTCKVTIGFTPIHDISPGIDHTGYNRAPIYPVGQFAHGKDK